MENIKIDDIRHYRFLSELKSSPEGDKTALLVKKAKDDDGYHSVIYVDKGSGFRPVTPLTGNVNFFVWHGNDQILFSEMRNPAHKKKLAKGFEITPFYELNIHGGEAQEAFVIDAKVLNIAPIGNGGFILHTAYDLNRPDLSGKPVYQQEELLEKEKKREWQIIDELPYWSNGAGFINKYRQGLSYYVPERGLLTISPREGNVTSFRLSACGRYVAFTGYIEPPENSVKKIGECLYVADLKTGALETIIDFPVQISGYDFYKGNLIVAYAKGTDPYDFNVVPTIYLLEIDSKSSKELYRYDRSIGSSVGTDCAIGGGCVFKVHGDNLYFISLRGYTSDLFMLSLEKGELNNLTKFNGSIKSFDAVNGKINVIAMAKGALQEVFTVTPDGPKKASGLNDEIYYAKKQPQLIHHLITDREGIDFDGWAMLPIDYDENKKYPAILNIHGGPKAAFGEVFFHEMAYWASQGYFVFFSNPRGSDGKGTTFSYLRGLYGSIDYDNLMQFMDEMLKVYPAVDSNRLGVTGGSYGGYMTNWIIGHTNRFAAAATQRSISNWTSYMIGDIGYYFTNYDVLANPWKDFEKLWDNSPLKYVNKAKTPTLILHSDEDYRCCVSEAYQLFTALKLHGVDTRLYVFHGENHELSRSGRPGNRIKRLEEITSWMDRYLK